MPAHRKLTPDRAWLQSFRDLMGKAYLHEFTQDDAAEHFGVCTNTLAAGLRQLGTSWLREQRAERRRRFSELSATIGPKSGVHFMEALGFDEPVTFYRWFQRNYGQTFRQWRATQQEQAK